MNETEKHANESPIKKANFLSLTFFSWLDPLMKKGYKSTLEMDDMYNVVHENSSGYLGEKLEREWRKEISKSKSGKSPSLFRALFRCFGFQLSLLGIIVLVEEATRLAQPVLLGRLLRYFSPDNNGMTTLDACMYAMGLSLSAMVLAVMHHPYFFYNSIIGMRMRIACCSVMYRKALRLNNKALAKITTGHIVNLMSNDVNRFDFATLFVHYLWVAPLQALAILIILWGYLGAASLSGFALLVVFTPMQGLLGRVFSYLRLKTAAQTDERVRLMDQIVAGMKVIKMYCWEKPFSELIAAVRSREVSWVLKTHLGKIPTIVPHVFMPKVCVFICCVVYVLSGHHLNAETVFTLILTFDILRTSLLFFIPLCITSLSECWTTTRRIQEFLMLEEVDESMMQKQLRPSLQECKIELTSFCGQWDSGSGILTLQDLTINVQAGELLAVVGPVGAGKSSLLMAVLGELPCISGSVEVKGHVAYAPQQPWIFSASVRQNIIFGLPFDGEKYERVIHACALEKDLESFPRGDLTPVGERGVALSGGQRARIGLARAVYCSADVYLLDDPLSAVDTAVSKHLFAECINGILKNQPRILVTHQLQYLKAANRILILKDSAVLGLGTYDELASSGIDFADLLKHGDPVASNGLSPHVPAIIVSPLMRSLSATASSPPESPHLTTSAAVGLQQYLSSRSIARTQLTMSHASLSATMAYEEASVRAAIGFDDEVLSALTEKNDHSPVHELANHSHAEAVVQGSVSLGVYKSYFMAGANVFVLLLSALLLVAGQGAYVVVDWWLSSWSSQEEAYTRNTNTRAAFYRDQNLGNMTTFNSSVNFTPSNYSSAMNSSVNVTLSNYSSAMNPLLDAYGETRMFYLYVYLALIGTLIVLSILRMVVFFKVCVAASRNLHNSMFVSVVHSPMRFFDTNPVGRILNRFSKDIGNIDDLLPVIFYDFLSCFLLIMGAILVATIINPWVLIPVTPILGLFLFVRRFYLYTSRAIKRLEGATRSPVFSHLSATLTGLYSVRAFRLQNTFSEEFDCHQDLHTEAWYLFLATSRWLAIRLDWLCVIFVTAVTFLSVFARDNMGLSATMVGLTVTYAVSLMGLFQWGVRQSAEVENLMTSVERVSEYTKLTPEAPRETLTRTPPDWPSKGEIVADGVCLQYSPKDPLVLKDITFTIHGGEKIGICGRTGAGKSSLLTMLFRLCEPRGHLKIDDVDIVKIGLHDLRSKISIIPQEPVLFSGSVRWNLDPFADHSDLELWDALKQVEMQPAVEELAGGLDAEVAECGSNFSVGQQQLLCLARALLRKNRILVIDEATANVDPRTDSFIQETIKEKFSSFTVLTIAHRLNTIMDSDRIMVLDDGRVSEFDEPYALLLKPQSLFRSLVEQMGTKDFAALQAIAQLAHDKRLEDNAVKQEQHQQQQVLPSSM